MLKNQVDILELFPELSYDELTEVMNKWLNPDEVSDEVSDEVTDVTGESSSTTEEADEPVASPTAQKAKVKPAADDDVEKQFADLFNS